MFENLTDKLQRAFKTLRGQGTLTEENIAEALREIRVALLEADVNLNVARDLIEGIRVKAVGTEVLTALSPSEQVIKIVRDELIGLLGKDTARFKFASQPPSVILMAGLQGSGKTTTSGKLAAWLKKGGHRPMLVSVDVYRPAAREQLKIVAKSIEAKLYEGDQKGEAAGSALVERLAKEALREALENLSYRERRVLELRYGLGGEHPRTLDEVGRTFNVTRERIRQIENQSLKKLQSLAEAQKLRDVA